MTSKTDEIIEGDLEYARSRAGQMVYEKVMDDFESGTLTAIGKGRAKYTVTNPYQAYAIAKTMAEKTEKRFNASAACHSLPGLLAK